MIRRDVKTWPELVTAVKEMDDGTTAPRVIVFHDPGEQTHHFIFGEHGLTKISSDRRGNPLFPEESSDRSRENPKRMRRVLCWKSPAEGCVPPAGVKPYKSRTLTNAVTASTKRQSISTRTRSQEKLKNPLFTLQSPFLVPILKTVTAASRSVRSLSRIAAGGGEQKQRQEVAGGAASPQEQSTAKAKAPDVLGARLEVRGVLHPLMKFAYMGYKLRAGERPLHSIAKFATWNDVSRNVAATIINAINTRIFHCRPSRIFSSNVRRDTIAVIAMLLNYARQFIKREGKLKPFSFSTDDIPSKNLSGGSVSGDDAWKTNFACIGAIARAARPNNFQRCYRDRFFSSTSAPNTPPSHLITTLCSMRAIPSKNGEVPYHTPNFINEPHNLNFTLNTRRNEQLFDAATGAASRSLHNSQELINPSRSIPDLWLPEYAVAPYCKCKGTRLLWPKINLGWLTP